MAQTRFGSFRHRPVLYGDQPDPAVPVAAGVQPGEVRQQARASWHGARPVSAVMREFETGATRNLDASKLDFEGFMSPLVMERFAEYMHANRVQADGRLRDSDNWQKGIPFNSYMKSGYRHFFDWWKWHRGLPAGEDVETALCALLFNVQGYLHETLKRRAVLESRREDEDVVVVVHHAAEAPMPPVLEIEDDDEPGSLKAGEAYRNPIGEDAE